MIDPVSTKLSATEIIADPYRFHAALAAQGGIVWNTSHKAWLVGNYEHVRLLLNHPDASVEKMAPFVAQVSGPLREKLELMMNIMGHWVVFIDPPRHGRIRKILQRGFMPRAIQALESQVRSTVIQLLDDIGDRAEIDFMGELAYQLPAIVISDLFGLPRGDVGRIKIWSDGISKFVLGSPDSKDKYDITFENMNEMHEYFSQVVDECDPGTGDTLLHKLVASNAEPEGLTREEIISTLVLILFAGHETTANLLGNSMLTLIRHKDRLQEVASGTVPLDVAIEELLRYEGPVPVVVRVARADMAVGEHMIRTGDRIFLLLHAANRDEAKFMDPGRIDFSRGKCPHLQFGFGTHLCLGAPLARLEGKVAFDELFRRYSDFELLGDHIDWRDELMTRGPRALPMRLVAR
jgi:cytochrome P450